MADIDAALREIVRLRAAGLCEYCRISERFTLAEHEIDHVIAVKHGGQTIAENLALCCAVCNRFKGSDIASIDPETGQLTPLFNPRVDHWDDHYQFAKWRNPGSDREGPRHSLASADESLRESQRAATSAALRPQQGCR